MKPNDEHKYDDIIDLPHHVSPTRARMTAVERAAQFSPFAALTGYDAAIDETARQTEARIELEEEQKLALSERLRRLDEAGSERPTAAITYFVPDERKSGGRYVTVTGQVRWIDPVERLVWLVGGDRISIDEIIAIEGELFASAESRGEEQ